LFFFLSPPLFFQAACFLDDSATLVVSVRSDNYFHYFDVSSGKGDDPYPN
jgi:hypothetical protein